MAFVKLDTGILESTLWVERSAREIFITALLMAEPRETTEELQQYEVDSLTPTGFIVPPGWYGFVKAAGIGIIRRALVDEKEGIEALRLLGDVDLQSRSPEHGGRRLVRVDGGFIVLNFFKYRDKDHTAAERQARLRARRKANVTPLQRNVTPLRGVTGRNITHADADADADADAEKSTTGFNSTEAAMGYCHTFSVVGQNNYDAIRQAIELAQKSPLGQDFTPQAVAETMIEARLKYEAMTGKKFEYPAVSFITSGIWKHPRKWKNGKSEPTEEELSEQLGASLR